MLLCWHGQIKDMYTRKDKKILYMHSSLVNGNMPCFISQEICIDFLRRIKGDTIFCIPSFKDVLCSNFSFIANGSFLSPIWIPTTMIIWRYSIFPTSTTNKEQSLLSATGEKGRKLWLSTWENGRKQRGIKKSESYFFHFADQKGTPKRIRVIANITFLLGVLVCTKPMFSATGMMEQSYIYTNIQTEGER